VSTLKVRSVSVEALDVGDFQPRSIVDKASDEFKQLVASIKDKGVMTPLLVAPAEAKGRFDVLAGARRLLAARELGLDEVPVRELADLSDSDKAEVALVDNLIRSDLSAYDVAVALKRLVEKLGVTQEQLAERLGTTPAKISKQMAILSAPDWLQKFVRTNNVGYSVADLLARLARKYPEGKVRKLVADYKAGKIGKRDLERSLSSVRGKSSEEVSKAEAAKSDPANKYSRLVTIDEEKGQVQMKPVRLSRSKPLSLEQADQIVTQLESLIGFVKGITAAKAPVKA